MENYIQHDAKFFNELAIDVNSKENKKWWFNEDGTEIYNPDDRLLTLVISELIEAFEGFRKSLKDDKLPHRDMVEVELADAILRLLDRMVGKKLTPFLHDYKYKINKDFENLSFHSKIYKCISKITNSSYNLSTEVLVYYILDISYSMGYDVISAINEKREYNTTRLDHTYEHRKGVNGKKF